jgi:D-glycero-D-manno-heptose 1,7-bisphosphate phosphatase
MAERAIFLDRDGTIITEQDFLSDPEKIELYPDAVSALRTALEKGYRLFVVSNQSGIARGLMTEDDVQAVNNRLIEILKAANIELDGIYYCPHHPDITGPCDCRKPGRGMVDQALKAHDIDLARSWVIGDTKGDMELAFNIGAGSVLVTTGYGAGQRELFTDGRQPDHVASGIKEAVDWIMRNGGR